MLGRSSANWSARCSKPTPGREGRGRGGSQQRRSGAETNLGDDGDGLLLTSCHAGRSSDFVGSGGTACRVRRASPALAQGGEGYASPGRQLPSKRCERRPGDRTPGVRDSSRLIRGGGGTL